MMVKWWQTDSEGCDDNNSGLMVVVSSWNINDDSSHVLIEMVTTKWW